MNNMALLEKMKSLLEMNYNDLIVKIILFGSRVDGTAKEYSDYDVLVVVNRIIDWKTRDSIRSILYDLNIEYDILLSVQVISEPELYTIHGKQPYIQNAIETGIAV
jgi:predicted nucleotidyltransferase